MPRMREEGSGLRTLRRLCAGRHAGTSAGCRGGGIAGSSQRLSRTEASARRVAEVGVSICSAVVGGCLTAFPGVEVCFIPPTEAGSHAGRSASGASAGGRVVAGVAWILRRKSRSFVWQGGSPDLQETRSPPGFAAPRALGAGGHAAERWDRIRCGSGRGRCCRGHNGAGRRACAVPARAADLATLPAAGPVIQGIKGGW